MIAEVSQRSAAPPLDDGYARRHTLCSTAACFSFLNSFVAFPSLSRVGRPRTTHDLRRASTRTDPNPHRGARVGRGDAVVGARRRTRPGGGGRLRVRLDGAGRHGGGGDRGPHRLGRPALLTAASATAPHPHADPHTHPDADADPDSAPSSTAALADAGPSEAAAHPHPAARRATRGAPRSAASADADGQTAPDAPPGAAAPAEAVRDAEPPPDPADRQLTAPPRDRGEAADPEHHVTSRLRPAHHHPRGGRRGRSASALTTARATDRPSLPGGTSCRNGLFSPSPCSPPAPSW